MELKKRIYCNGQFVNEFCCNGESASIELINLLLDKTQKRYGYKVNIKTDHIFNEIRATLEFERELQDQKMTKYKYEYLFKNVERMIDLY